jgi:hypothetical protein
MSAVRGTMVCVIGTHLQENVHLFQSVRPMIAQAVQCRRRAPSNRRALAGFAVGITTRVDTSTRFLTQPTPIVQFCDSQISFASAGAHGASTSGVGVPFVVNGLK